MTDREMGAYQFQLGIGAASNNDYDYAIDHFTQAIESIPDYWDAYYNRAICYANSNQLQLALYEMETLQSKMVAKGQSSVEVALCLSQYYFDLHQYALSIQWGKCVLQFLGHYTNGEALLRIARAYFALENPVAAFMHLSVYLDQGNNTDLRHAYMLRSSCYLQERIYSCALADMQKANDIMYDEDTERTMQQIRANLAKQDISFPQSTLNSVEELGDSQSESDAQIKRAGGRVNRTFGKT